LVSDCAMVFVPKIKFARINVIKIIFVFIAQILNGL
jgi:hypothetical protein